ncbi:ATP-binding protein [Streptomyces sp. NPDC012935]|uniref:ATP-binding protein n=1 Tax=Streptomyces sp. NPDC012935 TaxID=3364857 RepID=UPI0036B12A17
MEGALLGRDAELGWLRTGVGDVLAGSHAFMVIAAPAGMGKTRLLKETDALAREAGVRVLSARGTELEREYSLGLVRQLFEPLLHAATPEERDRWLSGAAGTARGMLSDTSSGGEFAMLHGLFWLTSNICQDTPLAMIIDDLHWADEPSLRFLAYLLPRLGDLPLLVVGALRPDEPDASGQLLDLILSDQECRTLTPAPLTERATGDALAQWFDRRPDPEFTRACHRATGGNPLLLAELTRALTRDAFPPTADTIPHVEHIGSRALARRIALELARLHPDTVRLARAIAVLGPHAHPAHAARLADIEPARLAGHLTHLHSAHLLQPSPPHPGGQAHLDFLHPLIRATIYRTTHPTERAALHARAADLLTAAGARPEQAAEHLLHTPPANNPQTVAILRRAATLAMSTGAPQAAHTYLHRATTEPPPPEQHVTVLMEAATAAFLTDLPAAKDYLDTAAVLAEDPTTQARLATLRELIHLLGFQDPDHTIAGVNEALERLPEDEDDLRRTLEAMLLAVPLVVPGRHHLLDRLPVLRELPPSTTLGSVGLDSMIAICDAYAGRPEAAGRARRVIADPRVHQAAADGAFLFMNASFPLVVYDPDEGISACDLLIDKARRTGSLLSLSALQGFRGLAWLQRGDLSEAAGELREALRLATAAHTPFQQYAVIAWLAQTLLEQGLLPEAEAVLAQALPGPSHKDREVYGFLLLAHAMVLHATGQEEQALRAALDAGRDFGASGGDNPAVLGWRSVAAACLHALDRGEEGLSLAQEELAAAMRWGAPHTVGRAQCTVGLLTPGAGAIPILEGAIETLRHTSARLDHAKALIARGAALRRANQRSSAREDLTAGMDLADMCGAALLVEHARTELRAAGARPRAPRQTGLEALTPSESRVARLAADGLTNRQIAQRLYVTAKTVEVHLSAVYRKLGIRHRSELAPHLAKPE